MAVFPERIVLKSSTDGDDAVQALVSENGQSPIVPGELVISREDGTVNLFALDANNEVVSASVPDLAGLTDVSLDNYSIIPNSSILTFNSGTQLWENAAAPPYSIGGNSLGDLGDVDLGTEVLRQGQFLVYNATAAKWQNVLVTPGDLTTEPITGPLVSGEVLRYNANQSDLGSLVGWEVTKLDYSDIENRPTDLSDLGQDLSLNDLTDVNLTGPDIGDIITWDGSQWSTANAQPIDLSNGFLAQLGDVSEVSLASGAVPVYNQSNATYEVKALPYNSISGAPTAVSQLTADVGVSHWANDAGYITNTEGLSSDSLSDFSVANAQEGQMLLYRSGFWVNEFGPPANISMSRIGELLDVTYYQPGTEPGVLTIDKMGTLNFDSPLSGSGYTQQLTYDVEYGLGMTFLRDIDNSGSAVYVERGRGVTLRADVNIVRLSGRPSTTDNRPELRFETGDSGADIGTGEYISLKMPQTVSESVVYYLPGADGDVGDVLATDGTGNLAWVTQASTPALGDLSDVDLVTIPPTGGEALIYNVIADTWIPGSVSNVDLSAESIDALGDVNTSGTPPQDGEGLVWYEATGQWAPGTVSDVDLSAESIDALSDVDTSSDGHVPTDGQVLTWHASMNHWMPQDPQGGSGGGAASDMVAASQLSASGYATFDTIGRSGILVEIGCDVDAWITFYPTAAARSSDTGRLFEADPAPGSGVLSEAYVEAGDTVLASPGTVYFNNDSTPADAIYVAVRTSTGVLLDGASVSVTAYPGVTGSPSGGGGGSAEALGDLTDVDLDTNPPTNGQVIVYNAALDKWLPEDQTGTGGGGAVNLDELLDVDVALPSDGQIISWFDDEAKWVKGPIATRWEYAFTEQYASNVSTLLNFNGNLDDETGLQTVGFTGAITYAAGPFGDQAVFLNSGMTIDIDPDPTLDLPGDFTVEMWVYPNSATGSFQGLAARRNFPGSDVIGNWVLYVNTAGIIEFGDLGNNDYKQTSSGLTGATWNHVALTRTSGVMRIFINGVLAATFTISTDFTSSEPLVLGRAAANFYLDGGISDFRVTKGIARYTADFAPPTTPLTLGSGAVGTMPLDILTDVSVPNPTPGQVLGWNNNSSRWEAVTPSNSGLPTANDGEALIWQNGAWAPGPVIGGVDYVGGDDDFNNVSLLLHLNGADGSTTIIDSSSNAFSVGVNQQAQIKTDQSRFGGASAYFDGDADYLQLPASDKFAMANGDFTIECFYRPTSKAADYPRIIQLGGSGWQTNDNLAILDRHEAANTKFSVAAYAVAGNSLILQSATDVVNGVWYHVAVTRNGSTFRLFIDGVEEASYTSTTTISTSASISGYIGGTIEGQTACANGHIDEVRITKGVARYTSSFTPPTAAFSDTGGQVTIPYSIDNLDDVDTSTVAPNNGQALVWNSTAEVWEPGTVSGGGGGSAEALGDLTDVALPGAIDAGASLIWNDNDSTWQPGPSTVEFRGSYLDPYFSNVTFLASYDTGYTDQINNAGPASTTGAQILPGKFSNALYLANNYLRYPTAGPVDVDMPGDFTIDFWVNLDNHNRDHCFLSKRFLNGASSGTWGIICGASGVWEFQDLQTITKFAGGALTPGQWHFITVERSGVVLKLYTDGVLNGTYSSSTDYTTSYELHVGKWDVAESRKMEGYIDDLRFTRGVARYSNNFTPPTSPANTIGQGVPFAPIGKLGDVDPTAATEGEALFWDDASKLWKPEPAIKLATLKSELASSSDFADFQSRIAAL